jgi:A/G-specific adenine glycosylase
MFRTFRRGEIVSNQIQVEPHWAKTFARLLVEWYEQNCRDLPWRRNPDPYRVWVSEIMLQQTRVEAVIPYYDRFMEWFPTLEDLAQAPEDRVLKAWEGLGYYSRARNLHQAVKEVQTQYGGNVPSEPEEMAKLPGVGPYTLGAVLSIAYNKEIPAVDGNVMRVISRILHIRDDISKPKTRKYIEQLVQLMIPKGKASSFNQGLMELGATVCIPANPRCLGCPVQSVCRGFAEGVQKELPIKEKKKPPKPQSMVVSVLQVGDQVWINRRPQTGLLAGLWQFPTYEVKGDLEHSLKESFRQDFGVQLIVKEQYATVEHTFSHVKWEMSVMLCTVSEDDLNYLLKTQNIDEGFGFVAIQDLEEFVFPNAHQKIVRMLTDASQLQSTIS